MTKWLYYGMLPGARGWGRPTNILAHTREIAVIQAEFYAQVRNHATFKVEKAPMTKSEIEALVAVYKTEIIDRAKQVDPDSEEDWHSLTLGWAIGKGMTVKEAKRFALVHRG